MIHRLDSSTDPPFDDDSSVTSWSFHRALESRLSARQRRLSRTSSVRRTTAEDRRVQFARRMAKSEENKKQIESKNVEFDSQTMKTMKQNSLENEGRKRSMTNPTVGSVTPEPNRKESWSFHKTLERQKQIESATSPRLRKRFDSVRGLMRKLSHKEKRTAAPAPLNRNMSSEDEQDDIVPPISPTTKSPQHQREDIPGKVSTDETVPLTRRRCATADQQVTKRKTWRRHLTLPKSPILRGRSHDVVNSVETSPRSKCSTECSSPMTPVQLTSRLSVIVVGLERTGKSTLIEILKERRKQYNEPAMDYAELSFIEIDNDKDDLWQSLSAAAFIVVFGTNSTISRDSAMNTVAILRTRRYSAEKPIMLVANYFTDATSNILSKKIKYASKQCQTPFFELSTALSDTVESLEYCLYSSIYDITEISGSPISPNRKKSFAEKSFFSVCLRRASRSCEDLLILRERIEKQTNIKD